MILASFSSGEDALSNDVKIDHTVSSQGTKNLQVRFLGTPGIPIHMQWIWYKLVFDTTVDKHSIVKPGLKLVPFQKWLSTGYIFNQWMYLQAARLYY